jgi:hypothetical protein
VRVVKPGKRLNAEMLGRNFVENVRIDRVVMEKCGEDKKPCLYFEGHASALVLNSTNIDTLVALFGSDESDHWIGRSVQLFTTMTTFQGKQTLGIRVRAAHHADPSPAPASAQSRETETGRIDGARPASRRDREPGDDDGPVQASQIRW